MIYPVKSKAVCPACGGRRWQINKDGLKVRCPFCCGTGLGHNVGDVIFHIKEMVINK